MADPWLKFYTSDWRADPRLKMCSLAARGLWMEMICLMHEATPYGQLLVSGQFPTDNQLAVLVGARPEQIPELIGELESAGVFSRTRGGVIYSRKMSRMQKKSAIARNNGRKGGNPSLSKDRDNPPLDKLEDKGGDKPQKPDTRYQIEEESYASSSKRVEEAYEKYLSVHPKPVDTDQGARMFHDLVAAGESPEKIIAAAQAYAASVKGWSSKGKVQRSDNFLDPDWGKWRAHVAAPPAAKPSDAEVLRYYADVVLSKKPTAGITVNSSMAGRLLHAKLVTEDDLKGAGVTL